ncbi:helix-turn-helix domain-containing protein [Leifsonia sp. NPDC058230]|uniref:helix-turn-helix domain-containing protein n=1 Tax=Leifsonia sp. NPDC058230 TaxID=3346391 RepID=UPI0036DDC9C9
MFPIPAHRSLQRGALDRALSSLDWPIEAARRERLASGERVRRVHDSAGLIYVSAGTVTVRAGHERSELSAGDLAILPRAHRVEIRATREASVVNAWFHPSGGSAQTLATFPDTLLVRDFSAREPNMAMLIEGMVCGAAGDSDYTRAGDAVVCSLISTTVVSAAIRLWAELGCAPERWLHQVSDPFIARALDAIHETPGEAWTVQDLARVATMSRSAFAERFTTVVGRTPSSYLTAVRMEAGKTLLARGMSVSETAQQLGYESEAGFRRAFRRHTGAAPATWRGRQRSDVLPAA